MRLRAPHVGRQDRRREADALGIVGGCLAIAHARLAHGDRPDAGHHLALGQMAVADDALAAILGLEIGMLAEKLGDLRLDCLGQQGTRPVAQDLGELVVERPWLNQFDDVIVGHGISLLWWRSGGVEHPHDMPPSRFTPSPTFGHSSAELTRDLSNVNRAPFVGEAGVASDHEQMPGTRQGRSDFFHHAVSKVILLRIAAHVGEWKDSN